ncbi:MAG TPA: M48 family metallopeptidase [Steroidobacteraceae bacterium]|nr:M48 family metallopeptidase [Steroidobacteraceae bacterium]
MHPLTLTFLIAVLGSVGLRLWLSQRQMSAVRAHRDRVPEPFRDAISAEDHRKAADYTVAHGRLNVIDTVLDGAVLLVLTLGGGIAAVDALWRSAGLDGPWLGVLVILSVMLLTTLVSLPLAAWRTFVVEARFGFNRTTPALFALDLLKSLLLGAALGAPLLYVILWTMWYTGESWWLYAWGIWLAFTLLVTWAWPVFIAPLFNRFSPLEDEALRQRIEHLLERCGFTSRGVFVVDGSRRSTHGNAYFTGLGRHKRIVFYDTLLERLGHGEVEAVLAHELGHLRLHHIRQRLIVMSFASLGGLALLGWLAAQPAFYAALGIESPSPHAALLLFLLVVPVFTYFLTPLAAWWSRRHEFEADAFAASHASAASLADALVSLYRDNATTLTPDRVHSAFYDSHPPALVRIARLKSLAGSGG